MKYTLNLGKVDYNNTGRKNCKVTLEVELKPASRTTAPYLTVDLEPIPENAVELSICGNIWNPRETDIYSGGQNYEEIEKLFPDSQSVQRLVSIWKDYHLNGMVSGTRAQEEALVDMPMAVYPDSHYDKACAWLKERGLYEVPIPEAVRANFDYKKDKDGNLPTVYKYGEAWLFWVLPQAVVDEVKEICQALTVRAPLPYEAPSDVPNAMATPEDVDDSLAGFCAKHGIHMEATYVAENPLREDGGSNDADHWQCVFTRGAKKFTTYFSMGSAHHGKKPKREEVLGCVAREAMDADNDFEGWCGELGFDTDSRKHKHIYDTIASQAKKLKKFLGDELFAEIANAELV